MSVGILFRYPVLAPSERVRFQERANWQRSGKWVQHGGVLTVTDQRLVCLPNRTDVGGRRIEVGLDQITGAQLLEAGFAAARERGLGALFGKQVRLDLTSGPGSLVVKVAEPDALFKALNLYS